MGLAVTETIAIIRASGHNSATRVTAFLDSGFRVGNLVCDPSKAGSHTMLTPVLFESDDRHSYPGAPSGIEILALSLRWQEERELALIEAVMANGIQRIFNLSVLGSASA